MAVPTLGAAGHLAPLDFMRRLGLTLTISPYRGTAPALTDVMGGHVKLMIDAAPALVPVAREGKMRALGILSHTRSKVAPDIPTMIEGGMADVRVCILVRAVGSQRHAPGIRQRVNGVMREAMADPEIVALLEKLLLEPVVETIDQTRSFIKAEAADKVELRLQPAVTNLPAGRSNI